MKGVYLPKGEKVIFGGHRIEKSQYGDMRSFILVLDLNSKTHKMNIFPQNTTISPNLILAREISFDSKEKYLFFAADKKGGHYFLGKWNLEESNLQLIKTINNFINIGPPKIMSDRHLFFVASSSTSPGVYDKGTLCVYDLENRKVDKIDYDAGTHFEVSCKRQVVFYLKFSGSDKLSTKTLIMYQQPGKYRTLAAVRTGEEPELYLSPDENLLAIISKPRKAVIIYNLNTHQKKELEIENLQSIDWCRDSRSLIGWTRKGKLVPEVFKISLPEQRPTFICNGAAPLCIDQNKILYVRSKNDSFFPYVFIVRDLETGDEYEIDVD